MRSALPLLCALSLLGCPPQVTPIDSGVDEPEDAGVDAGEPDAGRPPRDAGIPDAGFLAAPVADWCELLAQAKCFRDERCGRLGDAGAAGCAFLNTTVARCDQAAYTHGVTQGRVAYAERQAVDCLNATASGSCAVSPPACATVFTGLVPADGGCVLSDDCDVAQGFCDLYDDRCPHRCRAWTALGQPCDGFFSQCDPLAGSCDVPDAGAPAVCLPKKSAGDWCSRYDACGDDMACTSNTCVQRRAGAGEPCGVKNGYPFCDEEHFCRQDPTATSPGTCERKAGLGGTCASGTGCLPSLRCSALITTGTCLPKALPGEGCIAWDDCQDGLYCDAKAQKCLALPGPDGGCSYEVTAYRCAPGSSCTFSGTSDDRCDALKALGASCGYAGQCLSNDCEYGALPDGGFGGRCVESCSQRADGGP